jgi:hypothetical protein
MIYGLDEPPRGNVPAAQLDWIRRPERRFDHEIRPLSRMFTFQARERVRIISFSC